MPLTHSEANYSRGSGLLARLTDKLEDRLARIIYGPRQQPFWSLASALRAATLPYGALVQCRARFYQQGLIRQQVLPCPVISVGNIEMGGTGKTPLTLGLAGHILEMGYRPVILSRGYRGSATKKGLVVSDGDRVLAGAEKAGDEPYLMASRLKSVPVIIGRDRVAAGRMAIDIFRPHILLLDDGFQHLALFRDLDLVLLDSRLPFGNGFLLPRGSLRESVAALARSDAVVLTRCTDAEPAYLQDLQMALSPHPVFRSRHRIRVRGVAGAGETVKNLGELSVPETRQYGGKRMVAFSGLARNAAFFDSLGALDGRLVATLAFKDHHAFGRDDLEKIIDAARQGNGDLLVTSEKDYVRLPPGITLPLDLMVIGVDIDFGEDQRPWGLFIREKLEMLVERPHNRPGNTP